MLMFCVNFRSVKPLHSIANARLSTPFKAFSRHTIKKPAETATLLFFPSAKASFPLSFSEPHGQVEYLDRNYIHRSISWIRTFWKIQPFLIEGLFINHVVRAGVQKQTKSCQNIAEMQPKQRQNEAVMQPKCSCNVARMQL